MAEEPEPLSKEQKSAYYSLRSQVLGDKKNIPSASFSELLANPQADSQVARVMVRWEGFKEWNRFNDGFTERGSEDALVTVSDVIDDGAQGVLAIQQIEWLTHRKFFQSLTDEILEVTLYVPVRTDLAFARVLDLKVHSGSYKDGQRDGQWVTKNIVGAKLEEGSYRGGEKVGPWIIYWTNGKKRCNCSFRSGTEDGAWTYYYSSGKVSKKGAFQGGQKTGPWISYFENGQPEQTVTYRTGLKSGPTSRFWGNGKPREKGQYEGGQASGLWNYYHSNGKLQRKGSYKDGEKDGPWQQFAKDGSLLEEAVWREGRLIRQN